MAQAEYIAPQLFPTHPDILKTSFEPSSPQLNALYQQKKAEYYHEPCAQVPDRAGAIAWLRHISSAIRGDSFAGRRCVCYCMWSAVHAAVSCACVHGYHRSRLSCLGCSWPAGWLWQVATVATSVPLGGQMTSILQYGEVYTKLTNTYLA
jgi:hypothetical protein